MHFKEYGQFNPLEGKNNKSGLTDMLEKEKRILMRKMDRSRRVTNPNKYNPDGTIKQMYVPRIILFIRPLFLALSSDFENRLSL